MDFPVFHFDWLNDHLSIAVIAILHVSINHGPAVGFVPLVTWLEQKGVSSSPSQSDNRPRMGFFGLQPYEGWFHYHNHPGKTRQDYPQIPGFPMINDNVLEQLNKYILSTK